MSSDNLDQLANDLTIWRNNRKNKTEKMPLEYVRRAFALSKHVKQSEIEKKAKVFRYQYKRLKSSSEEKPTVHKFDLLTPNSFSVELGSGLRIDCQVGRDNFAEVITSLTRLLQEGRNA